MTDALPSPVLRPMKGRRSGFDQRSVPQAVLLYIAAFLLLVFAVLPFIWMVATSLQPNSRLLADTSAPLNIATFTLNGYQELFATYPVLQWLLNSLLVSAIVSAGATVVDAAAAYALARFAWRGRTTVFIIVLIPLMIPLQVLLVPLYLMMRDLGWINTYAAVIVPFLCSPTGIFLLRQHFITLPKELDEAAMVDGASRLRTLVSVIIPTSLAALGTQAIIKFIWVYGEFAWPSLVLNDTTKQTIPVGLAGFQNEFSPRWDLLMAGSVIAAVPLILGFFFLQKYFVRGLTAGGVAGE